MKRQIIKTRSTRPYRVIRAVILIVVLAAIAWAAYSVLRAREHAAQPATAPAFAVQDSRGGDRNLEVPIAVR